MENEAGYKMPSYTPYILRGAICKAFREEASGGWLPFGSVVSVSAEMSTEWMKVNDPDDGKLCQAILSISLCAVPVGKFPTGDMDGSTEWAITMDSGYDNGNEGARYGQSMSWTLNMIKKNIPERNGLLDQPVVEYDTICRLKSLVEWENSTIPGRSSYRLPDSVLDDAAEVIGMISCMGGKVCVCRRK